MSDEAKKNAIRLYDCPACEHERLEMLQSSEDRVGWINYLLCRCEFCGFTEEHKGKDAERRYHEIVSNAQHQPEGATK